MRLQLISRFFRYPKYSLFGLILMISMIGLGVKFYGNFIHHSVSKKSVHKLVEVIPVQFMKLQQSVELIGIIHAKHATTLVAKGSGMLDALALSGQTVKKGELIAQMANPDLEKNLHLSLVSEKLAKEQFHQLKPLIAKGFVSTQEAAQKKQALLEAQKEVSKIRIELDNLRFYAPFDGIIGAYKKREGAQVTVGEAVLNLYDPATLVVDFDVPCNNLKAIRTGQTVHVLGKAYQLTHIQRMIDEESNMCPAHVDIQCRDCLIGSAVTITVVTKERDHALAIPFQALFLKEGQPSVYVVEAGKIVLKSVKTGIKQKDTIEILSGLKPGQWVVLKAQERLYPGLTVDSQISNIKQ